MHRKSYFIKSVTLLPSPRYSSLSGRDSMRRRDREGVRLIAFRHERRRILNETAGARVEATERNERRGRNGRKRRRWRMKTTSLEEERRDGAVRGMLEERAKVPYKRISLTSGFDSIKDGWIRHRAYGRSISGLTLLKMKCTLGDVEADPNVLSAYRPPVPFPVPRGNATRPTERAYLRERRVPRVGSYDHPLDMPDFEYKSLPYSLLAGQYIIIIPTSGTPTGSERVNDP
ncbi:hypothetical protein WN55_08289 [Dufourea novaeangliae]|uniref:Uncharacterized protein n=1 Tax=Dufourea novaeangliae TaxID=178035 RepID=A0A154P8H7_DUFNO|nr:hypothetical protein WN55_08289 [Dufourea novaeangliae]